MMTMMVMMMMKCHACKHLFFKIRLIFARKKCQHKREVSTVIKSSRAASSITFQVSPECGFGDNCSMNHSIL